ncbi:hypothetical protein ACFQAO_001294, partial [Salmonella enterica]
ARSFLPSSGARVFASKKTSLPLSLLCITPPVDVKIKLPCYNHIKMLSRSQPVKCFIFAFYLQ